MIYLRRWINCRRRYPCFKSSLKFFIQSSIQKFRSEAPINSASYRSAGPSDAKAAAKGLKSGRRFPESENKLGLSSPAQALACPLEEAPPEPFPNKFTGRLRAPDVELYRFT